MAISWRLGGPHGRTHKKTFCAHQGSLGQPWSHLGPFSGCHGSILARLGAFLAHLGTAWACLGAIFAHLGAFWGSSQAIFGHLWAVLTLVWRHPKAAQSHLQPSQAVLGAPMGRHKNMFFFVCAHRSSLGQPWSLLRPSSGCLGAILACLGAVLVHLGAVWACLGAILARSWAVLGPSWAILGHLGLSWVVWRLLRAIFVHLRPSWRAPMGIVMDKSLCMSLSFFL